MTEDNDTNDNNTPNNVVDDGDNKHPSGKDKSVENGRSGNQGNSTSDPDDDGRGPDRSNGGADKPDGPGGEDLADQDGNNGCGNDDDFEDDNEGWCGKPALVDSDEDVAPVEGDKPDTCTDGSTDAQNVCEDKDEPCTGEMTGGVDCDGVDMGAGEAPCTDDMATAEDECAVEDAAPCEEQMVEGATAECEPATAPSSDLKYEDEQVLGIQGQSAPEVESGMTRFLSAAGLPSGMVAAVSGAPDALAATGLPTVVLALLALSGLGVGAGLVRRGRQR